MIIRRYKQLLSYLIIAVSIFITTNATADNDPNRIAFAISGGASKGAYEAGLMWGMIEVVRQLEKTKEWSLGGEPRRVEIASLTGTSAGGINTLLGAMVWSVNPEEKGGFANQIDDNIFRDVWLIPDVNRLLPPEADSPRYLSGDALLSRKDLVAVARQLREKWNRPGTFRKGLRLPLGLTVTRVKPEVMVVSGVAVNNQRFLVPFEMRTQEDGSARFSFDPTAYPSFTDPAMILMPWPAGAPAFSLSDQQIEDIILTTSAFPTGFGRKRLQYCRQKAIYTDEESDVSPLQVDADISPGELICPDGYEIAEAEFADGGLFDNLPIGLARELSESSTLHRNNPLPVSYIYLDPDRQRYDIPDPEDKLACESENPPEACRELTFNFLSETAVLGGAMGTARKYELYQELTSDNWNLNLIQLSNKIADIIDENALDVDCTSVLPYFDRSLECSDRLRYSARLLSLAYDYNIVPIKAPTAVSGLLQDGVATRCRPPEGSLEQEIISECIFDHKKLRQHLTNALIDISNKSGPESKKLNKDIRRSALSIDSDRMLQVTSRGGPITGELLGSFGAFLEYKFREFDYLVGIYDASMLISNNQCMLNFPDQSQQTQFMTCRDQMSEEFYRLMGVVDNPKAKYVFALMAKREYGKKERLKYAYDPMPTEDRDMRIIYEGLETVLITARGSKRKGLLPTEREFFEHLKAEQFEPTPPPGGGKSLLTLIIDDPEYWSYELVNRSTSRMVYLETLAEDIYRAREPDPDKRVKANTALMGAGALALRTAAYKYPKFAFSPSTAPESWFWRNIIPYEIDFDLADGDMLLFWQPTMNFKTTNASIRLGLGFTGGLGNRHSVENRENYGVIGLDLTRIVNTWIFSGWGVTPALFHDWQEPAVGNQTSFGFDVHANLFKNRIRIGLGARDAIENAEDTIFLTIGIADLPGLAYWMSR
ncbi:MAG: patatin-like phospholipase family protein [Deltaproteobacteria bacterium]|nr:patatin-like phospholipase family protein [Deltaproteobacteria bacterium]